MLLIQLILRLFGPTYCIIIRKTFSLINGITFELLNASSSFFLFFLFERNRTFYGNRAIFIYPNHYMFEISKGSRKFINRSNQRVLNVFIIASFNKYLLYCPLLHKYCESLNSLI